MNELSKSLGLGRFEKVSQHAEAVEKAASPTGGSASSTTPWHPNITSHISDDPGDPPFDRAPAASARAALHTFEAETGRKGSHASAAAAHAEAAGLHREAAAYYEKQDEPSWAKHHLKLADHHAYMAGDHENFCQGVTMSELGKSFGLGRFLQACNHKQLSETMYKAQASDQTEVVEKAKEGPRGTGPSDPDAVATVASMAMKPPTHYIHSHKAGESDQDTYYTYHQERAPNNLGQELGILNRHANHVIAHGTAPQLAHLWGHLEHRLGEFEGRRMATSGNEPPASAYDLPTKVGNALRAKLAKTPPRYLIGKSFDERLEEVVEKAKKNV